MFAATIWARPTTRRTLLISNSNSSPSTTTTSNSSSMAWRRPESSPSTLGPTTRPETMIRIQIISRHRTSSARVHLTTRPETMSADRYYLYTGNAHLLPGYTWQPGLRLWSGYNLISAAYIYCPDTPYNPTWSVSSVTNIIPQWRLAECEANSPDRPENASFTSRRKAPIRIQQTLGFFSWKRAMRIL